MKYLAKVLVALVMVLVIAGVPAMKGEPYLGGFFLIAGLALLLYSHVRRCRECNSWLTWVKEVRSEDRHMKVLHVYTNLFCSRCGAKKELRHRRYSARPGGSYYGPMY